MVPSAGVSSVLASSTPITLRVEDGIVTRLKRCRLTLSCYAPPRRTRGVSRLKC